MPPSDDVYLVAGSTRSTALFRTRRGYVVALGVGFMACILLNGYLRHVGNPRRFPLRSAETYQVDPDGNPFQSLTEWRALATGDFRPIYDAAMARRESPNGRMYRPELLRHHVSSFVYTPFTALLVSPLARPGVSMFAAANWVSGVNHVMWAAGGVMLLLMMTHRRPRTFGVIAVFAVHYVAYYPMAKALQLTQASVWIFFFLTLSAFLFQRRRDVTAGVALAVGVSIKPHLVVILVLLFLTPRFPWRVIVACVAGLAATTAASVWYAGIENCHEYVFETLPALSAGYAYFPNQSINGMLHRLFTQIDPAVYNLAPSVPWITAASTAFGIALLAATAIALRRTRRATGGDTLLLGFVASLVAATAASPVCWEHHLTVLLIAFAVVVNLAWQEKAFRSTCMDVALLASFLLTGFFFDTRHFGGWPMALLSGMGFYGLLIVLVCQWTLLGRSARAAASAPTTR
jgi:hypothetical protein